MGIRNWIAVVVMVGSWACAAGALPQKNTPTPLIRIG
jgi:hypothetical protein